MTDEIVALASKAEKENLRFSLSFPLVPEIILLLRIEKVKIS